MRRISSFVGLEELALVVEVEQLVALVVVEEQAAVVEELERVVLGRIVRGGERDAAARARGVDEHLDGGRGQNADVHHFAAGGEQAAGDRVLQHGAARARVAAHHDAAGPHVRSERLGEGAGELRREELADHAADSGYADLEQVFARHYRKLLTCSITPSNSSCGGSPRCSQMTRTIGSVWLTRTWNQRPG